MSKSVLAGAAAIFVIAGSATTYCLWAGTPWTGGWFGTGTAKSVSIAIDTVQPGGPVVADPTLRPISAQSAQEINMAVPLQPVGFVATPLIVAEGTPSWDRALLCLTQTVYYEAGSESPEGQRAVAQVVLNRVRSQAFPNSICGVVYQGSGRSTGCQFTFTCDGSLRRVPNAVGWLRALGVARAALRGSVYAPVGYATYYHANYVVPYWAPTLAKIQTIGAHIFYRWPGSWRPATYFSQLYANVEPDESVMLAAATAPSGPITLIPAMANDLPPITAPAIPVAAPKPPSNLFADDKKSTLIAGENTPTLDPKLNTRTVLAADLQSGKLTPTPSMRASDR